MDKLGYQQLIDVLHAELDGLTPVVRAVPEGDQNIPIFNVEVNTPVTPHRLLDALHKANEVCEGLELRAILIGNTSMTLADITVRPKTAF